MAAPAATGSGEISTPAAERATASAAGWAITANAIRSAAARTTGGLGTWCTATTTSATGFTDTTRFSHTACSSWFSNTTCTAGFSYTSRASWFADTSWFSNATYPARTARFADTTNASDSANAAGFANPTRAADPARSTATESIGSVPIAIGSISAVFRVVLPVVALAAIDVVGLIVVIYVLVVPVNINVAVTPAAAPTPTPAPCGAERETGAPRQTHPRVVARIFVGIVRISGLAINDCWIV